MTSPYHRTSSPHILIIGAGIGGLTTAALLAHSGFRVTVLEGHTYPGGSAGTFFHKGYRFEAGATVAGGFQENGPHSLVGKLLNIDWPVHQHNPAWIVHLPDHQIALDTSSEDVLRQFPRARFFWEKQRQTADQAWALSAQGLPWPPGSLHELWQIGKVGLRNFPQDLRLIPFAFRTVYDWLRQEKLAGDRAFVRFIDAQLLIAAQTTSPYVNALYGATALDLPRQGVYHVEGGIGGLAESLVRRIEELGGQVFYRNQVTGIRVENEHVTGVFARQGRKSTKTAFFPADFVIANLTLWSLDKLLGENSPAALRREAAERQAGWGAFALHLGIAADQIPADLADHHQIISDLKGPMGEGRSLFISMSPEWDQTRAPQGHRAVTVTTHTDVSSWWRLDEAAYQARKVEYTEKIIGAIDKTIPGFRSSIRLTLSGTPITYQFYTGRHLGMVGGFPQTSLFQARGPRTGIANLRLVGDSIFPGQSTAGVTLGAMRVAAEIQHLLSSRVSRRTFLPACRRESQV